ncbi:MAG: 50S ribosomal protein L25 [Candidatus Kerfeldbacteria bacterium]|nr:50S ribosomal protein L25 [Candidatus Kerfeldbacteria bacterium]
MADTFTLQAKTRTALGRASTVKLREQQYIPAVIYGHGLPTRSIMVQMNPFIKVYEAAGESSLIDVIIDDQAPTKAIIHGLQHDPLSQRISHIDFHQVRMDETIKAEVELVFEGESAAVKNLNGILIKNISELEIECLPADLPHDIRIDISRLKTFEDMIRVSDLTLPAGVTVLNDSEDMIATVEEPRSEAELASLNEQVVEDVSAVEVAKAPEKDKEAAEGESTPEAKK